MPAPEPQSDRAVEHAIDRLRRTNGRILTGFLWANVACVALIILWIGSPNATMIAAIAVVTALVASAAWHAAPIALETRVLNTLALSVFPALYLALAEGSAVVVDIHMTFFAMLAIGAMWCCWRSLVVAAAFIVLHHLVLNALYPYAVFPQASGIERVLLHGFVVVLEVAALGVLTQRLVASLAATEQALVTAANAQAAALSLAEAQHERAEAEAGKSRALRDEISRFERDVGALMKRIEAATAVLDGTSVHLKRVASDSERQAAIAEQSAVASVGQVETVAHSASSLSSALSEVTERVTETATMAADGTRAAGETRRELDRHELSMREIDGIVQLIRTFANQTNLLSLNATIEAARAGESGRGFAIVAQEVKQLADQTAKAVDEVGGHVARMRNSSESVAIVVRSMTDMMLKVDANARAIMDAVIEQRAAMSEISAAADRVAHTTRAMGDYVETAGEATRLTAATSDEVLAASTDVRGASADLSRAIDHLLRRLKAA